MGVSLDGCIYAHVYLRWCKEFEQKFASTQVSTSSQCQAFPSIDIIPLFLVSVFLDVKSSLTLLSRGLGEEKLFSVLWLFSNWNSWEQLPEEKYSFDVVTLRAESTRSSAAGRFHVPSDQHSELGDWCQSRTERTDFSEVFSSSKYTKQMHSPEKCDTKGLQFSQIELYLQTNCKNYIHHAKGCLFVNPQVTLPKCVFICNI